jgi:HEAT repeat protein
MLLRALFLSTLLVQQADSARQARDLIEKLRSDKVEEREEAIKKLIELGKPGSSELEKATTHSDIEVATRARRVLRIFELRDQLPARLQAAIPQVAERLSTGDDHSWTEVFLSVAEKDANGNLPIVTLRREDLNVLAAPSVRGARTDEEWDRVCNAVVELRLRSAVPALISLLQGPTAEVRGRSAYVLAKMRVKEATPEIVKLRRVEEGPRHRGLPPSQTRASRITALGSSSQTPLTDPRSYYPRQQQR